MYLLPTSIDHLLRAKPYAKCFMVILSLNPQNNCMR